MTTWQLYWHRPSGIGASCHALRWTALVHYGLLILTGAKLVSLDECDPC